MTGRFFLVAIAIALVIALLLSSLTLLASGNDPASPTPRGILEQGALDE